LAAAIACVVPPAQAAEVVNALIAAFPGAADQILAAIQSDPNVPETCKVAVQQTTQPMMIGGTFNTVNQTTNQTNTLQTQNTENQQYQEQKADQGRAPSPSI